MPTLARLLVATLALALLPASVFAADWQVVKVSGDAWVASASGAPMRATVGMTLSGDATVTTKAHARVMLQHEEDAVSIGPDSEVAPQSREMHGLTTVLMRQGDAEFEVGHRAEPHFTVETPYLAALVKGTHFKVKIRRTIAAVSVTRGRVQVTVFALRRAADVVAGQTATLTAKGFVVSGAGPLPVIREIPARAPLIQAALDTTGTTSTASAEAAGSALTGVTNTVASTVGDVTTTLDGTVSSTAGTVGNTVGTVGSTVGSTTAGTLGGVGSTVSGTTGALGNTVGSTTGALGNTVGGVVGGAGNTVGSVGSTAGNTVSSVGGAVGGTVASTGSTVGSTVASAGSTVGSTVGSVGSTVGSVGGGLGGLVGGL